MRVADGDTEHPYRNANGTYQIEILSSLAHVQAVHTVEMIARHVLRDSTIDRVYNITVPNFSASPYEHFVHVNVHTGPLSECSTTTSTLRFSAPRIIPRIDTD